ncbi:UbiA family prenyltransferase [Terasakiella sp. SH-1]|uniref:UbiA family prenyltransferase n=1 Tax=Terasakiella sp. SH-1 TaxID=2560057 RepID=UPI0010744A2B|nr:UbiA family prenyltransferase [Terasakiella sp. SH-1]
MNLHTALKLGRVSNLPTVFTNVFAAVALSGSQFDDPKLGLVLIAMFLFYIGGMYLNDAFDHEIDAQERPNRPIPSGEASLKEVFSIGSFCLVGGIGCLQFVSYLSEAENWFTNLVASLILAGLILFYNVHHKKNFFSPVVMGGCRFMVYLCSVICLAAPLNEQVLLGGLCLLSWIVGLTYLAKKEISLEINNLFFASFLLLPLLYLAYSSPLDAPVILGVWLGLCVVVGAILYTTRRQKKQEIGKNVTILIAAISLLDAVMILQTGQVLWGLVAALAFFLTLFLQRTIPGT